jgi:hypothetical protein
MIPLENYIDSTKQISSLACQMTESDKEHKNSWIQSLSQGGNSL